MASFALLYHVDWTLTALSLMSEMTGELHAHTAMPANNKSGDSLFMGSLLLPGLASLLLIVV
jgi:hypothetical protein